MNKTGIDYLTHSWNPLAMLCTPVSPGCANCWHRRMAARLAANPTISFLQQHAYEGKRRPLLIPGRLDEPAEQKKAARIGVQFMGDLFHTGVTATQIEMVVQACRRAPQHNFFFLTKRANRALRILTRAGWWGDEPPKNIWLGVSVEGAAQIHRIDTLVDIPAARRWVSFEPLLGMVPGELDAYEARLWDTLLRRLDWAVIGCESGPGRRPMPHQAALDLARDLLAAFVPVFVKQIEVGSRVSHDVAEWPVMLRLQQFPAEMEASV